jgi:fructose-1,6-bisphosphatase/inositol monophosphatase family enzyme
LAELLRLAAKSEILPRFRRLGSGDVRAKSEPTDLVTEADIEAERMIRRALQEWAPDAVFIGEESVAADPALFGKLADAELAVVVDPVDGTFNFASGIPAFGVMASMVWKGETVAGIIYDPMGDDWVLAEKGAGAYFRRVDGEPCAWRSPMPSHWVPWSGWRHAAISSAGTGSGYWAISPRSASLPTTGAQLTNIVPLPEGTSTSCSTTS